MKTKREKEQIILSETLNKKYEYGFTTDIDQETLPPGLNENVIRIISNKKEEPEWLLDWRLKAYKRWKKMKNPLRNKLLKGWSAAIKKTLSN